MNLLFSNPPRNLVLATALISVVSATTTAQSNLGVEPDAAGAALGRYLVDACERGDSRAVDALIAAGADVNYRALGDGTPLIVAARRGHAQIAATLLANGADANRSARGDGNPLIAAAAAGQMEIAIELVEHGADVDTVVPGNETALINAAARGHRAMVEYLVANGADVNLSVLANPGSTEELRSPLSEARKHGHELVVAYLENHGAIAP